MVADRRSTPARLTVADYDALPDDGPRYELIDGVLIEMPAPTPLHQQVQLQLAALLFWFVTQHRLGRVFTAPLDVQVSSGIVQPDILFIAAHRADIVSDRRVEGAPDLVVEISSPSTRDHDLGDKLDLYRREGVREYWFIDLVARTATVRVLVGNRYVVQRADPDGRVSSSVLDGFAVDIARLFDEG